MRVLGISEFTNVVNAVATKRDQVKNFLILEEVQSLRYRPQTVRLCQRRVIQM